MIVLDNKGRVVRARNETVRPCPPIRLTAPAGEDAKNGEYIFIVGFVSGLSNRLVDDDREDARLKYWRRGDCSLSDLGLVGMNTFDGGNGLFLEIDGYRQRIDVVIPSAVVMVVVRGARPKF